MKYMSTISETTSNTSTPVESNNLPSSETSNQPKYAKLYSRFASYIVDNILLSIVIGVVSGVIFLISSQISPSFQLIFTIVGLLLPLVILIAYPTYFLSSSGATLGMKLVGIKTTKENGNLLTIRESLIRNTVYLLMVFFVTVIQIIPIIGLIISLILYPLFFTYCLKDSKKQNLYDKIFNNIYISDNEKTTLSKIVVGCGCSFFILAAISIGVGIGLFINTFLAGSSTSSESVNGILRMIMMQNQGSLPSGDNSSNFNEMYNQNLTNAENEQNIPNFQDTSPSEVLVNETSPSTITLDTIKSNPTYTQCSQNIKNITQDPTLIQKYDQYCICATTEVINGEINPQKILENCSDRIQ